MNNSAIKAAVELHIECFKDSFLASLDRDILTCMYENYVTSELGCAYVYIEDGEIVGLVAGAINPSVYYNQMLKKRGVHIIWLMLKRVLKEPGVLASIARRNFRGFFRPDKSEESYCKASFDVIGVKQEARSMGVALQLIESLLDGFKARGVSEVTMGVSATNTGLKRFYEMIGFRRLRTIKHPDGGEVCIYGVKFDNDST